MTTSPIIANIAMEIGKVAEIIVSSDALQYESMIETPTYNLLHKSLDVFDFKSSRPVHEEINDTTQLKNLKRELQETQELYRMVSDQFKEKNDNGTDFDKEIDLLRRRLQESRQDYDALSSKILKHNSEKDFQQKHLIIENDELKRKRDEQELEIKRLEKNFQTTVAELDSSLNISRDRFLKLLEEKAKLETDFLQSKAEKKELLSQIRMKDIKIIEHVSSREALNKELSIIKKNYNVDDHDILKLKNLNKNIKTLEELLDNTKQNLNASKTREEILKQELESANARIEIYENKLNDPTANEQHILNELSNIILSKDKTHMMDPKIRSMFKQVFGENCNRLMDNCEGIVKTLQKDKQELRDKLVYEMELRSQCLMETKESFDFILKLRGRDREIESKKRQINDEIKAIDKQILVEHTISNETCIKSPRDLSRIKGIDLEPLNNDGVENLKSIIEKLRIDHFKEKLLMQEEANEFKAFISELNEKISDQQQIVANEDLIGFLQCEAAALEETLAESQNYFGDDSFSNI